MWCKLRSTKVTMDRPYSWKNKHTSFMNLSLKHVRIEAHNLMHVKGLKRHYKASMQNMQGVLKPTWYKVIIWQYEHKIQPWHNQQTTKHGASSRGKIGPFQGQQGEGVTLSFLGLQGIIFTTEIPQDFSGEETPTPKSRSSHKIAQNEAFSRAKGGQTSPKHKTLLTNNKED